MKPTTPKTRAAGKRRANCRPAATYLALIDLFPLRPLRSERDYDTAVTVLDRLAVRRCRAGPLGIGRCRCVRNARVSQFGALLSDAATFAAGPHAHSLSDNSYEQPLVLPQLGQA